MKWPLLATEIGRDITKNIFQFQDNITYERNPWILGILNNFKRSNYRIRVHSNAAF